MTKRSKHIMSDWEKEHFSGRQDEKVCVEMNAFRKHTETTILYPEDKIMMESQGDWEVILANTVHYYLTEIEDGHLKWNGETDECRIKQMKKYVKRHFYFGESHAAEMKLNHVIDYLIFSDRNFNS